VIELARSLLLTPAQIAVRLANARTEMAKMDEPGFFDAVIVNAELETAYAELKALINRLVVRLPSV